MVAPVAARVRWHENRGVKPHLPINHPLRPLYRLLAGLAALYVLIFGIVGLVRTAGTGFFGREHTYALGLRTNVAFAVLSIVVGSFVFAGIVLGRNFDHYINIVGGFVFLLAGIGMLAVLRTSANFLNFTVATCLASYAIGLALLLSGLYGRVGPSQEAEQEEAYRHRAATPQQHEGTPPNVPETGGSQSEPETRGSRGGAGTGRCPTATTP